MFYDSWTENWVMICHLRFFIRVKLATFAAILKMVKFEATRNCFGIRYKKYKFNAVIIIGYVSFIKVEYLSKQNNWTVWIWDRQGNEG